MKFKLIALMILAVGALGNSPLSAMQQPKDLIQAAKDGDVERVRELISTLNRIEKLINKEAYLNQIDAKGNTALIWAAYNGHLPVVKALLAAGANVNAISNGGYTPLMNAIKGNHLDIVKELIQAKNVDLEQTGENKQTPLIWAAYKGHLPVVKALLAAGADVNAQSNEGNTPLMNALVGNHPEIAKELIQAEKINLSLANIAGQTAFGLAIYQRMPELAKKILIKLKEFKHESHKLDLAWAAKLGYLDLVKMMIHLGVDISDDEGPLIWAAQENKIDCVLALLTEFSKEDAERIRNQIIGMIILFKNAKPELPRDIRNLIRHQVIADLVEERLERARKTMSIKNKDGLTAQEIANLNENPAMAALLDPNNQTSQDELRELIKKNIYAILRDSHEEALEAEKSKN